MVDSNLDLIISYNFKVLGSFIKKLRTDKDMSQNTLAKKAFISRQALGKIEAGKVEPKISTLVFLSNILDYDLLAFFNSLHNPINSINIVLSEIDRSILSRDLSSIDELTKILKAFKKTYPSKLISNYVNQIILLTKSMVETYEHKNFITSIGLLTDAMKITNKKFSIKDHNDYTFHNFELRIVNSLITGLRRTKDYDLAINLATESLKILRDVDKLYLSILYNLANCFYSMDKIEDSKNIVDYASRVSSYKTRKLHSIHFTYLDGLLKYSEGRDSFVDSINHSYSLANFHSDFEALAGIIYRNSISFLALGFSQKTSRFFY